ncbi:uncharacterized protein LOC121405939 [Lytechinus variegatus]|uniref:uncharacterized protein LOC121405939 n=1 Tax=Lytechinus variegatus TaxID=7654 RepID=UPI001BB1A391|nr:uncharacterized protein LOC121405939 [Lytechinus variegatus]
MAIMTHLTLFITLSVMAITGVHSQMMGAKSEIFEVMKQSCGLYQKELREEGPTCNVEFMNEFVDELDNIEYVPVNRLDADQVEDLAEAYVNQAEGRAKGRHLCFEMTGEKITSGCQLMEGVCTYYRNVIHCLQNGGQPAVPTAAPTNPPVFTTTPPPFTA